MTKPLVIGGYTGMKSNLDLDLGGDTEGLIDWIESADQLEGLPPETHLYFVSNIHPDWWPIGVEALAKARGHELLPVNHDTADTLLAAIADARFPP